MKVTIQETQTSINRNFQVAVHADASEKAQKHWRTNFKSTETSASHCSTEIEEEYTVSSGKRLATSYCSAEDECLEALLYTTSVQITRCRTWLA